MTIREWQELIAKFDRADMYGKIMRFSLMIREAVDICLKSDFSFTGAIENIVGCGMGGSGVGLEMAKRWLVPDLKVPFEIVKDYSLPSYVSNKTLLYVASYSGNTDEMLSCLRQGIDSKANTFTVSSGGELRDISKEFGLNHVAIPPSSPARAAFPFLFVPLIWLLAKSNLIPNERIDELEESVPYIEQALVKCGFDMEDDKNEAKSLSNTMSDRFPIVYGHGIMSAVALRFKQQLNENAKGFASQNSFPELDHNEFEGVQFLPMNRPLVLILRYREEAAKLARKIELTKRMLSESYSDVIEAWGIGKSRIAEAMSLMAKLDMTSFYLSMIRGVDPSATPRITRLGLANKGQ